MQRLAVFLNVDVKDIIDIIEVDIKNETIIVEGEEGYKGIEQMIKERKDEA